MQPFGFELLHQDTKTRARLGVIHTPHGNIATPAFVPVGTQATVKSLTPQELKALGTDVFFVNTYHMYLRPGIDVVAKFGGLHRFMDWDKPLMTDSGGFQVFSLARHDAEVANENLDVSSVSLAEHRYQLFGNHRRSQNEAPQNFVGSPRLPLVKITEEGVEFRSHWDGSKHLFTPQFSMELQWQLGSDIHIAFDDCPPYPVTNEVAQKSMTRTHRWAKESLDAHRRIAKGQPLYEALYGSIQGSTFEDLRKESAKFIAGMDFDGIAIGGVAVGESKKEMVNVLDWVTPFLPKTKPRHLLGVGEIDDIFALISRGIDTFDCVQPTRMARMGKVFAKGGDMDLMNKKFDKDTQPIEKDCNCYTCQHFSRAYLHHLFRVRELLVYRLATIHNIYFINSLIAAIRSSIAHGSFLELANQWLYNT